MKKSILVLVCCMAALTMSGCTTGQNVSVANESTKETSAPESTTPDVNPTVSQENSSEQSQSTATAESLEKTEIKTEDTENLVSLGKTTTVSGYTYGSDGDEFEVTLSLAVDRVISGNDAYQMLLKQDSELIVPDNMEYIIVDLAATYVKGDVETLSLDENVASLGSASFYFILVSTDGTAAENLTYLLDDSIYDQELSKGETKHGKVAFLHPVESNDSLSFVGYGNTLKFSIK